MTGISTEHFSKWPALDNSQGTYTIPKASDSAKTNILRENRGINYRRTERLKARPRLERVSSPRNPQHAWQLGDVRSIDLNTHSQRRGIGGAPRESKGRRRKGDKGEGKHEKFVKLVLKPVRGTLVSDLFASKPNRLGLPRIPS